ncbi:MULTISPECIES: response regulator [Hyphobacterium]|uniref:Response regulator n=1 Tax=Hyphobacterium vulgare TaxID=1736751 RepID=A0ABV6ZUR0_9PROT
MADLRPLRILIVDDNPHMLKIVRTILNAFGVTLIYEALSGHEALEVARNEAIDIIITDYQMDGMNGVELIKSLRDQNRVANPLVPIIMLSAYSEKSRVFEARDAGTTEFCCKPITAKDLLAKIAMIIDRPRPFVRTKVYFGPDRRRHDPSKYRGPERRSDDEAKPNVA